VRRAALIVPLLAGGAILAGCGRDVYRPASFAEVDAAVAGAGLRVCAREDVSARAPGARAARRYDVGRACRPGSGRATLLVTEYDDAGARDAAARGLEVQSRPPASGAVWTLGPFTLAIGGERDGDVVDRLTDGLDRRGAS
jgi:hypothetical protein